HRADNPPLRDGEVYKRAEWEGSTYNFEESDVAEHFAAFDHCEAEAKRLLWRGVDPKAKDARPDPAKALVLPAYDFVVKAAHRFNVLDARGAISVTERQRFIGRVRALAKLTAETWLAAGGAARFPVAENPLSR